MHHDHRLPNGVDPAAHTDEALQAMRTARCPVCSKHDHTDREPFGYGRDRQPIPAWWFTCPDCGTAESQLHCHTWTKAGIAWIKDNPDFRGTRHRTEQQPQEAAA